MCHSHDARRWDRTAEETEAETDDPEEDPSFFDDDPAEDVELLTDGGDGDD